MLTLASIAFHSEYSIRGKLLLSEHIKDLSVGLKASHYKNCFLFGNNFMYLSCMPSHVKRVLRVHLWFLIKCQWVMPVLVGHLTTSVLTQSTTRSLAAWVEFDQVPKDTVISNCSRVKKNKKKTVYALQKELRSHFLGAEMVQAEVEVVSFKTLERYEQERGDHKYISSVLLLCSSPESNQNVMS